MRRRNFGRAALLGAVAVTASIAGGSSALAEPGRSKVLEEVFGADDLEYLDSRPELRSIVEEDMEGASNESLRGALAELRRLEDAGDAAPSGGTRGSRDGGDIRPAGGVCVTVYKWMIIALSWEMRLRGAVMGVGAGLVAFTVAGLPAAAVLGSLGVGVGMTGEGLKNWANERTWPKNVCLTVS